MKKWVFLALMGLTLQHWDSIDSFVFGHPHYSAAENEVILYATEWCGYCQKTRDLFKRNDIQYVEYDIEKSEMRRQEHKRLGGKGVPLLQINGKVIHGYQPERILAALNSG